MTDAELLRQAQAGDVSAWDRLYQRYLPTVWRYVYLQVGGDEHLAEDVVSETILALVRQIRSLTPRDGGLSGWLIAVARNKLSDQRRIAGREICAMKALGDRGQADAACSSPSSSLEAAETRGQVIAVMDRLPDEERLALEWKYLDDLSVGEIADRLARTEKAVESVLYRARRAFRSHYQSLFGRDL